MHQPAITCISTTVTGLKSTLVINDSLKFRLDFLTLTLEQPNDQTVCAVDTFQVVGATNQIPVICGDNPNQHSKNWLPLRYLKLLSQLLNSVPQPSIVSDWAPASVYIGPVDNNEVVEYQNFIAALFDQLLG